MRLFRSGSLAVRLAASLVAVQVAVISGWLLLFMSVSPDLSYEDLAAADAQERIAAQVVGTQSGLSLERSPAFERYLLRRPTLDFAVAA